eukprot:CAMPEP_0113969902 /NCGR_PEP_ID=MMETSP0011_2-20120614/10683_1 /TAXON_ID=101924 /ORGANISM="Rhodosorus marinus" /LENGTH=85 /DNA_ID=CAMNT_0000983827 /DNA_START=713 /DNA_END=970 /DNA_ORIENTATION=+ /assembly_acc=CAM_ASM_000156
MARTIGEARCSRTGERGQLMGQGSFTYDAPQRYLGHRSTGWNPSSLRSAKSQAYLHLGNEKRRALWKILEEDRILYEFLFYSYRV